MIGSLVLPSIAGALVADSAPHLASAAAGRRHLTPLGGRESGPGVNAVWAAANLVGGLLLLSWLRARGQRRAWGRDLLRIEAGYFAFAAWMAGSERWLRVNSAPAPPINPAG